MKSPVAAGADIEWHHSRQHATSRQALAQHRHVSNAVLQTDDHGVRRRMPRNDIGDLSSVRAFDRDQHRAGIGKNGRMFGQ